MTTSMIWIFDMVVLVLIGVLVGFSLSWQLGIATVLAMFLIMSAIGQAVRGVAKTLLAIHNQDKPEYKRLTIK